MVKPVPDGMVLYVCGLVQGLGELQIERELDYEPVLMVSPQEKGRLDRGEVKWNQGFRTETVAAPFLNPREWIEIPAALKKIKANLYHSPTFSSLPYCPCPAIITINDLNHLIYGSWDKKLYYRFVLKPFARRAAQVLSVSETAAREVEAWLGKQNCHVGVGVALNSVEPSRMDVEAGFLEARNLKSGQYFLCMANAKAHKNVALLLRAFLRYVRNRKKANRPPWSLVLSTDFQGLTPDEKGEIAPFAVASEGMGPKDYQPLFAAAGGVLWPSLYEGFGRPPVEAALAGKNLAVSDIPVHLEVLSDLKIGEALWVEATREEAWTEAMDLISNGMKSCGASAETQQALAVRFSSLALGKRMDHYYRFVLRGFNCCENITS